MWLSRLRKPRAMPPEGLEPAVDGLGGAVRAVGVVEEREDVRHAAFEGASERGEFGASGRTAFDGEGFDELVHHAPPLAPVLVRVTGDDLLVRAVREGERLVRGEGHHPHGLRLPPRHQPHRPDHAPMQRTRHPTTTTHNLTHKNSRSLKDRYSCRVFWVIPQAWVD